MSFQRIYAFSKKNAIELWNDKVSLIITIGLPFLFILLFYIISPAILTSSEDKPFFNEEILTMSLLFAYALLAMFVIVVISKDKKSGFLKRIAIAPIKSYEITIGYSIPFVIIGYIQFISMSIIAFAFGMNFNWLFLFNLISVLPMLLFFTSIAILLGSLTSEKVAPMLGTVLMVCIFALTPSSFDMSLTSNDALSIIAYILPFANIYDLFFKPIIGETTYLWVHLLITIAYTILLISTSGIVFKKILKK